MELVSKKLQGFIGSMAAKSRPRKFARASNRGATQTNFAKRFEARAKTNA